MLKEKFENEPEEAAETPEKIETTEAAEEDKEESAEVTEVSTNEGTEETSEDNNEESNKEEKDKKDKELKDSTENAENADSSEDVETAENSEENSSDNSTENSAEDNAEFEQKILSKFGNIADNLESLIILAKEGKENRDLEIDKALTSGVHSMGNAFNKEIFKKTFSNMETKDIKAMGEAWEKEAANNLKKGKVSMQDFSQKENNIDFNYNLDNFKTDNY